MDIIDNENLLIRADNENRSMREHTKKLKIARSVRDVKKYCFTHSSVEVWNRLSEEMVSAGSVHTFKKRSWTCIDMETGPHQCNPRPRKATTR